MTTVQGKTDTGRAADLFTSTVATFAVSAAWELGILNELHEHEHLELTVFAKDHDLNERALRGIVDALGCAEVVTPVRGDTVLPGPAFEEVFETKGFFYWLTRGCGELFSTMGELVPNEARMGDFIHRDLGAVATATRDMGDFAFDAPFFGLLDQIAYETAADLGCGSAERLIKMSAGKPSFHGVGIDISEGALMVAEEAVREAGLADRIALVRSDARCLPALRQFEDVDLVTCFLMGHDMWPREQCIKSLRCLRDAFPNIETFILCDTFRSEALPSRHAPFFTPGFEVAHAVMGQYLPTLAEWQGVFGEGGWKCVEQVDLARPPFTAMFVLTLA